MYKRQALYRAAAYPVVGLWELFKQLIPKALADGEESTLIDVLVNHNAANTDDELAFKASLKTEIDRSLSTLTERQKDVIRFFFGIGVDHALSLEDIGEHFNLTRERVRQIKDKAITKLRTASRCKLLKTYLGT